MGHLELNRGTLGIQTWGQSRNLPSGITQPWQGYQQSIAWLLTWLHPPCPALPPRLPAEWKLGGGRNNPAGGQSRLESPWERGHSPSYRAHRISLRTHTWATTTSSTSTTSSTHVTCSTNFTRPVIIKVNVSGDNSGAGNNEMEIPCLQLPPLKNCVP